MKPFFKMVSHGVSILILYTILATVTSEISRGSSIPRSQNETVLANGELLKRVGEFASRTLWVKRGKLILPKGTVLNLTPKITIPAFRQKAFKGGLNSDIQASLVFYVFCDKLGITDPMHPFPFDRPPFYPFGQHMRPIGEEEKMDKDKKEKEEKPADEPPKGPPHHGPPHGLQDHIHYYEPHAGDSYKSAKPDTVYTYFPIHKRIGAEQNRPVFGARRHIRKSRSVMSLPPPEKLPGGERAVMLPSIENMLSNVGFEGKGCMLRAICEIHEFPMKEGYGLLGEMIALFFSVSESPYAETHMPEYLKAEDAGRTRGCSEYKKGCAKSIFKWEIEKRRHDDDEETNEIPSSLYRTRFGDDEL